MSLPFVQRHIEQLVLSKLKQGTKRVSYHLPSNPEGKLKMLHRLEKGFKGVRSFVRVEDLFEPTSESERSHLHRNPLSQRQPELVRHQRLFSQMEASKSNLKTEINEKYWLQKQRIREDIRRKERELCERVERVRSENLERNAKFWLVRVDRSKENLETASRVLDQVMRSKRIRWQGIKDLPPVSRAAAGYSKKKSRRHLKKKESAPALIKSSMPAIHKRLKQLASLLSAAPSENPLEVQQIQSNRASCKKLR